VALTSARKSSLASLVAGLAIIALAQGAAPATSPPLYDGVFPIDAYKWLSPPPGEHGGAKGISATVRPQSGRSPLLAIATPDEQPPQAQIFGPPGGLTLPAGTTEIRMAITPVPTEGILVDGHIAGNVYRISVTDQDGRPLTAPASAFVTVVLRGPGNLAEATVERFVNGAWQPLKTTPAGIGSTFIAVVTEFGDFTLVAPGPAPSIAGSGAPASGTASPAESPASPSATPEASPSPSPVTGGDQTPLLVGIAIGAGLLAGLAVWLVTGARNRGRW
jgi:hypothetical protein